MDAIFCDKCNKLFKKDKIVHIKIVGMFENENPELDLCDKCKDKLEDWIYLEVKK